MRGGSECIIGFELNHRPDHNAHRRKRLLERMELREKRRLDAGAGLVVRPKPIAKRLDHVVGGDSEVGVAVLDHLEHGLEHADDGAVRAVLAFGKPAQAVEVTEELIGAVDEVNDHFLVNVRVKGFASRADLVGRRNIVTSKNRNERIYEKTIGG